MDDERIETRPLFRFENFCDRERIERVRRQPINGLGRQRDDFARAQQFNRRQWIG